MCHPCLRSITSERERPSGTTSASPESARAKGVPGGSVVLTVTDEQSALATFANYCWPNAIKREDGRWRRGWIVRTAKTLPSQAELGEATRDIPRRVELRMHSQIGDAPMERPGINPLPEVDLVRVDDCHVIVWVVTDDPGQAGSAVTMVGTVQALRLVDDWFGIQDLQGMPKEHWVIFLMVPEASDAAG